MSPPLQYTIGYESGHLLNFLVLNVFSFGRRFVTAVHFIICAVALFALLGISESGWCTFIRVFHFLVLKLGGFI